MCGRYAASASQELLVETFEIDEVAGPLPPPSFNVAPTDPIPAVVERTVGDQVVRRLVGVRWGLVPSWSRSATGGSRLINARIETVAEKPAFRKAFAARRCLLPADGYYEWYPTQRIDTRGKPVKQPFFIRPRDGRPLVMAGLYEFWKDPDGAWLVTAAIITTRATDELGHIHDRMPMIVPPDDWDAWLDPGLTTDARALLVAPAPDLEAYQVSTLVNRVANNGPELIEPLANPS